MKRVLVLSTAAFFLCCAEAFAQSQSGQSFEIGAQVATAHIGELDVQDVGFGGRASWFPSHLIGVEGELNFFPRDVPPSRAISGSRLEGLFGVTAGPRINQWRPFVRARAGFLRVGSSPEPVVCALIFPPAISCGLAAGDTLFTTDIGGGIELFTPAKTFVRVDVGDRMLRYPGPAIDRAGDVHNGAFLDHDLRFVVGAGWRF